MSYIEMTCTCGASFQYDSDNETRLDLLSQQFVNQHHECGYMAKPYVNRERQEKTVRYDVTYKEPKEKEL
jgi:hypothetical protein